MRQTEYTVYLHTISRRAFMQPSGIYRNIAIPACPKEKRSHCFMQIQHPVQIPHLNPDDVNGLPAIKIENAIRVALGICNPDYAGTDLSVQEKELNPESVLASGECNLTRQGVFASMNAVPTEEELDRAEKRREAYYRFRLNEADGLERSNPRQLQHILQLDHHMAADFFAVEANWHRAPSQKVDCPNCGGKIPAGVAFHYDNGRACILDWERSWLAGAVKKDDVPEPKRWWSEEEPVKRGPGRPPKVEQEV
jgi:cytochrome c1